jgi:hypothetical protein
VRGRLAPEDLFNTNSADLGKVCKAETDLSNAVLHQRRHSVSDGLGPQFFHFGLALDQGFYFVRALEEFVNAGAAPIGGVAAFGTAYT